MKYSILLVSFLLVHEVELGIISMGPKPGKLQRSTTTTPYPTSTTTVVSVPTLLSLKEVDPIVSNIVKSDKVVKPQGSNPSTLQGSSTTTHKSETTTTEGSIPPTMQTSVPVKEAKPIVLNIGKTDYGIKLQGPKPGTLQGSTTTTPKHTEAINGPAPTSNFKPVKEINPVVSNIFKSLKEKISRGQMTGSLQRSSSITSKPTKTPKGSVPTSVPIKEVNRVIDRMELQRLKTDTSLAYSTTTRSFVPTTKPSKVAVPSIELNRIQDKTPKSPQSLASTTTTLGSTTTTPRPTTKESIPTSPRLNVAESINLNIDLNMEPKPMGPKPMGLKPSTGTLLGSTTTTVPSDTTTDRGHTSTTVRGYTSTTVPGYTSTTGRGYTSTTGRGYTSTTVPGYKSTTVVAVPPEIPRATCPKPALQRGVPILVYYTGHTLTYKCLYGYRHVSGDLKRTCMKNGRWDGSAPVCRP
ncbi:Hypothetical predicted protein [Mytilus galloprovincialis]|uniref:Sushi domain-containing protein n=1 Tax=Mytilus galloprovincialis TaxID=29158 RepID=A0A8B6FE86_MYTGA|nr:Hypothetical predicted protein [Mytilus galloprovincialis]